MAKERFGVGIIGLQPETSWAARAHVPALKELSDDFEIVAVANSHIESSQRAAEWLNVRPYASAADLVTALDIDIVVVTVRVPYHFDVVEAAINAGKHVYCEWPLGNGLVEAKKLADMAKTKGVLGVIGTQARLAPEVRYLRQLLEEGYVGDILSATLVGRGGQWGGSIPNEASFAYLLDNMNGATMLTIPVGHTLAAVTDVLGGFAEFSARLATRYKEATVADTGDILPVTAPDQVLVSGVLSCGAPISIHYRGGLPREGGAGFLWEINGTKGDIQISAPFGHTQLAPLLLAGTTGQAPLRPIEVPQSLYNNLSPDPVSGNVARIYAQLAADLRDGSRVAPTFDDAVALHSVIAGIEEAAASGDRYRF